MNETPEDGVKLRHEHRRGHAFAGHVADDEIKVCFSCLNDINVVPADRPGGLITIIEMPGAEAQVVRRQQRSLHLRCEIQIFFKSAAFVGVEMVQTKPLERVCDESI